MMHGRTILCFASGYDAPPTSKHHVMRILARRNTVLWVNYHASRRPTAGPSDLRHMAGRLGGVFRGLTKAAAGLYVLTPLVLPLPTSPWARRINRSLLTRQIHRALRPLRTGPLQVWSFCPDVAYLLDGLEAERVVYYCVDDFASFTGYDRAQVLRDEAELCRRADLVVTTSRALCRTKGKLNPRTILVRHGVDWGHFARAVLDPPPAPRDVAAIGRPRIGFFGLIRDWVDLDLVAAVARRRPAWQFVFLGGSTVDLSPFRALENVHFLGARPYASLPAYCRQMDAAMIPFKVNNLTRAVNPIKLREYLAAGLGVVSTPLPEVRRYEHLVEIGDGADAFDAALERVLHTDGDAREERVRAMQRETWPRKVRQICEHLKAPRRHAAAKGPEGAR
ncbi:MAG TPA: glycosyltransferase [Phycisphaerae bacterium]|nr:glycosyltransferase [Phycisphaerae bacterium]